MKQPAINWPEAIKPLLRKYRNTKHPLEAKNRYQLLVMVVLSAQTTDAIVNTIAPELFRAFPDMEALSKNSPELLFPYIAKVRSFRQKATRLIALAKEKKQTTKYRWKWMNSLSCPVLAENRPTSFEGNGLRGSENKESSENSELSNVVPHLRELSIAQ